MKLKRKIYRILAGLMAMLMVIGAVPLTGLTVRAEEDGKLLCTLSEHVHSEECYETRLACGYVDTQEQVVAAETEDADEAAGELTGDADSEEHVHNEDCYETVLVCEQEEHTHTKECYFGSAAEEGEEADPAESEDTDMAEDSELSEDASETEDDSAFSEDILLEEDPSQNVPLKDEYDDKLPYLKKIDEIMNMTGSDIAPDLYGKEKDPYGYGLNVPFVMNPGSELMLYQTYNTEQKSDVRKWTTWFDTWEGEGKSLNLSKDNIDDKGGFKNTGSYDDTNGYNYVESVAFDPNNTGRKDHVAYIGFDPDENSVVVWVVDTTVKNRGDYCRTFMSLGYKNWIEDDELDQFQAGNYFAITAGDYNHDGRETIVAYIPDDNNDYGLAEFTYDGTNNKLSRSYWGYKDLLHEKYAQESGSFGLYMAQSKKAQNKLCCDLVTDDFNGDGIDDLAVLSYICNPSGKDGGTDWDKLHYEYYTPWLSIATGKKKEGGNVKDLDKFGQSVGKVTEDKDTKVKTIETMISPGISAGDINADEKVEVVISGLKNTVKTKKDSNYTDEDFKISTDKFYFAVGGLLGSGSNNKTNLDYGEADSNAWIKEGTFPRRDDVWSPTPVECVAFNGKGSAEYVFISGQIFDLSEFTDKTDGSNNKTPREKFKAPYFKSSDTGAGRFAVTNTFIASTAVGNFDNNPYGYEQIFYAVGLKESGYRDYVYFLGVIGGKNYDDKGGAVGSNGKSDLFYSNNGNYIIYNKGDYTDKRVNCVLTAMDRDEDGIKARFAAKCYNYADPKVVAILQAAPYFEEVGREGQTTYSLQEGFSYSTSTSDSVSFGIGGKVNVETSAVALEIEAGKEYGWTHSFEDSFSKSEVMTYTTADEDTVLLSRTPVVSYIYETWDDSNKKFGTDENYVFSISFAQPSRFSQVSIERYNELAQAYNDAFWDPSTTPEPLMKKLEYDWLGQKGNPFGYPTNLTPAGTTFSPKPLDIAGDSTEMEASRETSTTESLEQEHGFSFSICALTGPKVLGHGVQAGAKTSLDYMSGAGSSTTKSEAVTVKGSVSNLKVDPNANDKGLTRENLEDYGFEWILGTTNVDLGVAGENAMVIGYNVTKVKAGVPIVKDLEAHSADENKIVLKWSKPDDSKGNQKIEGYNIYKVKDNGSLQKLNAAIVKDTAYEIKDEVPGIMVKAVVTSVSATGAEGIHSNVAQATPGSGIEVEIDLSGISDTMAYTGKNWKSPAGKIKGTLIDKSNYGGDFKCEWTSTDYRTSYPDGPKDAGTYMLHVTAVKSGYIGSATKEITIKPVTVKAEAGNYKITAEYRPAALPMETSAAGELVLKGVLDSDKQKVSLRAEKIDNISNRNVGGQDKIRIWLDVTGEAGSNYVLESESMEVPFAVTPRKTDLDAGLEYATVAYSGQKLKPTVDVSDKIDNKTYVLSPDQDYDVEYGENLNAGTGTVTIKAKKGGNYTFEDIVKTFEIVKGEYSGVNQFETNIKFGEEKTGVIVDLSYILKTIKGSAITKASLKDNNTSLVSNVTITDDKYGVKFDAAKVDEKTTVPISIQIVSDNFNDITAEINVIFSDHEHTYDEETWISNEVSHWHICTECGDRKDIAEHVPDRAEATDKDPKTCKICGYEMAPAKKVVKVTFDACGGRGLNGDELSVEVTYGKPYTSARIGEESAFADGNLPLLYMDGYVFKGWFTKKSGGSEVNDDTLMKSVKNHTLYAQWTAKTYTVTLDLGQVFPAGEQNQEITVTYGKAYSNLPDLKHEDYNFDGWYTQQNGGVRITKKDIVELAYDHNLYARWTEVKSDLKAELDEAKPLVYNGKVQTPKIKVYGVNGRLLEEKKDYTVKFSNNVAANTYNSETKEWTNKKKIPTIKVTGKGNYSGNVTMYFEIKPYDLGGSEISAAPIMLSYNGKVQKAKPVVKFGAKTLKAGTDYILSYPNTDPGITEEGNPNAYDPSAFKDAPEKGSKDYNIIITAKEGGNFKGSITVKETITQLIPMNKVTVKAIPAQKYNNGEEIKPELSISYKSKPVDKDNFDIAYQNNKEPGTASVIITAKPDSGYEGSVEKSFIITGGKKLGGGNVVLESRVTYDPINPNAARPALTVKDGTGPIDEWLGKTEEGKNYGYTVEWPAEIKAGKAKVTVTGVKNYTGKVIKSFTVDPFTAEEYPAESYNAKSGKGMVVEVKTPVYVKGGAVLKSSDLTVRYVDDTNNSNRKEITLTPDKDYTISISSNTDIKKDFVVKVNFKGNYKGFINKNIKVAAQSVNNLGMTAEDIVFNAKPGKFTTAVKLTDINGKALQVNKDYILEYYRGNTKAEDKKLDPKNGALTKEDTCVTVVAKGVGNYSGEKAVTYSIKEALMKSAKISLASGVVKYYNGSAVTLNEDELIVKAGNKTLKRGVDYDVSYSNNVNVGKATVTVTGKGIYGGSKNYTFNIKARKMNLLDSLKILFK